MADHLIVAAMVAVWLAAVDQSGRVEGVGPPRRAPQVLFLASPALTILAIRVSRSPLIAAPSAASFLGVGAVVLDSPAAGLLLGADQIALALYLVSWLDR